MAKSIYDVDNDGVVDNSTRLANNLPAFYLDRANQTGSQLASTIGDFSEAVGDSVGSLLVAGTNVTLSYSDAANTLTIASTATGGGTGDMNKSIYDVDNNGVVDDSTRLANNLPSFYLDRANQSGTQLASTIGDFGEAVGDSVASILAAGANITISYNDPANTLTIASTASGGGLTQWQLKTSNYSAVTKDRIFVELSSANLTISLPTAPVLGDEVEIQRIDTSANSLIISSGGIPFKGVATQDGLLNNGNIGLSERIVYVGPTVGWLPQSDRLTYQTSLVTLLRLNFEGADNSTVFTDSSLFNRTVTRTGTPTISTTSPISGLSSGLFNGVASPTSQLSVPSSADFDFGTSNFSVKGKIKTTQSGNRKAIVNRKTSGFISGSGAWLVCNDFGNIAVFLADFAVGTAFLRSTVPVSDGSNHEFEWSRVGNLWALTVDGITVTATNTLTIQPSAFPVSIGRDISSTALTFDGLIDDIIIQK
jgi:hypothetical protein